MDASPFTAVAKVVKTRGLDGEVAVTPLVEADLGTTLEDLPLWPVPPRWAPRPLHVQAVRPSRAEGSAVVSFCEVHDVATARRLVGSLLLVRTDLLPEAVVARDDDLLGFAVVDDSRGHLGEIADVIVTGANDVWVVHGPLGEVLVPVIPDVVLHLDVKSRTALVRLLPGLIDEEQTCG